MYSFDTFSEECNQIAEKATRTLPYLSASALYADLFYENSVSHSFLQTRQPGPGKPRTQQYTERHQGVGLYAFNDSIQAFTSLPGLPDLPALARATEDLSQQLGNRLDREATRLVVSNYHKPIPVPDNPGLISPEQKKRLIEELLDTAYSFEPSLKGASAEYQDHIRNTCIINTCREVTERWEAWIGLRLSIALEVGGRMVQSHASRYAKDRFGLLAFGLLNELVLEAVQAARHIHASRPVTSGTMPVLFAGASSSHSHSEASLWLHECVGHMLEADQTPKYGILDQLRHPLASPLLSIADGPASADPSSSLFDDEGHPANETILIESGQLTNLLSDRYHAHLHGFDPSGNGYRQSYQHPPLPRMSGLHVLPGTASPGDIISSINEGVYVKSIQHGHTLSSSKHFELVVKEGFYIENGELTYPVSNLVIRGDCLNALKNIIHIGNDLPVTPCTVKCVKVGQTIPVSVNAPTVLINNLEVVQQS